MTGRENERFRRRDRLLVPSQFSAALRVGRALRGEFIRLSLRENSLDRGRLGIAVGRKVCPLAVGRNYMKRAFREVFRRQREIFIGLDAVVTPRRVFGHDAFLTVEREFVSLVRGYRWSKSSHC